MKNIFINSYLKRNPIIENTLLDFYKFIKKPNDEQIELNLKDKIIFMLILLVIKIIITLSIIIPLILVIHHTINLKFSRVKYSDTLTNSILLVLFIGPLIEELIFRYYLRYRGEKTETLRYYKWNKYFPWIVYTMVITFGLVHLTNYLNSNNWFYILSPIIISSQLFGGLILSFVRVRLNFYYGYLFHSFWNFIFIILFPSIQSLFTSPYVENNKNYSIKIEEKLFFDNDESQFFKIDYVYP